MKNHKIKLITILIVLSTFFYIALFACPQLKKILINPNPACCDLPIKFSIQLGALEPDEESFSFTTVQYELTDPNGNKTTLAGDKTTLANFKTEIEGEWKIKLIAAEGDLKKKNGTIFKKVYSTSEFPTPESFIVICVDLDIDTVADPIEFTKGGYIGLGDNKLTELKLGFGPASVSTGNLTLDAIKGGEKVKVWADVGKTIPVNLPKTWIVNAMPKTLYLEGVHGSIEERDITLKLTYNSSIIECSDTIRVTVFSIKMNSIDANFAPSVEKLYVRYSIKPIGFTTSFGKIEVFKKGDNINAIYKDEKIKKTGTNIFYEWDGKANLGANNGKFVGPKDSAYTIKISISEKSNFAPSCSDQKTSEVIIDSITLTPNGAENLIKPNITAIVVDKDIEALIKIKKKDGTGALTEILLKVDWSFEDPDDTATNAGIDSNGVSGNDNAPILKGGKSGTESIMWKAKGGYTATIKKNFADSETKVAVPDKGKTVIQFSASAIGGDNYILVAQIKDEAGSTVLKDEKTGVWSVRKKVKFNNIQRCSKFYR